MVCPPSGSVMLQTRQNNVLSQTTAENRILREKPPNRDGFRQLCEGHGEMFLFSEQVSWGHFVVFSSQEGVEGAVKPKKGVERH